MRIVAAVTDLMFKARLLSAAERAGATLAIVDAPDRFLAEARQGADLLVVDLGARVFEPDSLLRLRKEDPVASGIPTIGFFSHVEVDVRTRAIEAGIDAAWPRSRFFSELEDLFAGRVAVR